MAEERLVDIDLERGRVLLEQLEQSRFPVRAAAWVYESGNDRWRLYLVTSVEKQGLSEAYLSVAEAMLANPEWKEDLKQVSIKIVDSKAPLGKTLIDWSRNAGRSHRRVFGPTADGDLVDAVVYGHAA